MGSKTSLGLRRLSTEMQTSNAYISINIHSKKEKKIKNKLHLKIIKNMLYLSSF